MARTNDILRRLDEASKTQLKAVVTPSATENLTIQVYDHIAGFNGICPVTPDLMCGAKREATIDRYCARGIDHCFVAHLFDPDEYTYFILGSFLEYNNIDPRDLYRLRGTLAVFWANPRIPSVAGIHRIAEAGRAQDVSLYRHMGPGMFYLRGDPKYACRFVRNSVSLREINEWQDSFRGKPYDWTGDKVVRAILQRGRTTHQRMQTQSHAGAAESLAQIDRLQRLLSRPRADWPPVGPPVSASNVTGSRRGFVTRSPEVVVRAGPLRSAGNGPSIRPSPSVPPPPQAAGPATPTAARSGPGHTSAAAPPDRQAAFGPESALRAARPTTAVGTEVGPSAMVEVLDAAHEPPRERPGAPPAMTVADTPGLDHGQVEELLARYWRVKGRLVGDTELHALFGFVRNFRTLRFEPVGLGLQAANSTDVPTEKQLQAVMDALRVTVGVRGRDAERRTVRLAERVLSAVERDDRVGLDDDVDNAVAVLTAIRAGRSLVGEELRECLQLDSGADRRRPLLRALLRAVESLGVTISDVDKFASNGNVRTEDILIPLDAFAARLHGRSREETEFVRVALLSAAPAGTRLLCLARSVAGVVESVVVVGANWRSLDPFKAPHPWAEAVPPPERWRDEADILAIRANEEGQPSQHWGEGARRIDALGSLAGEFVTMVHQQAVRNFYRRVVEQLGESHIRLGAVIARHLHDVLPAVEVEVWETSDLRPVHQARLVATANEYSVEYRDGDSLMPTSTHRGDTRRTLQSLSVDDGAPHISMKPLPSWTSDRGIDGLASVAKLGNTSGHAHVCTVSVPLRVGDVVVELLRVSLLSSGGATEGSALSAKVVEDLAFPVSLAEKHAKGVTSGRRGAQQDIAAMVSHSIKNWLQPAQADLGGLSGVLEEFAIDDERIDGKLGSLRYILDLVQARVHMLYLLSSQRIAHADIRERTANQFRADLRRIFERAWDGFTKDNDYSSKIDAYSSDGIPTRPTLVVELDGPESAILRIHTVTVEYAFEEVFLNCFRHSHVAAPAAVTITVGIELLVDEGTVEALVVNPGALPTVDTRGGTDSGGRRFGRESLRVILEDLLRGKFELRDGGAGVEARLRFPMDQHTLAGDRK